jgi:FKBP-type peptidyl-prolyl cis-trans isomerase
MTNHKRIKTVRTITTSIKKDPNDERKEPLKQQEPPTEHQPPLSRKQQRALRKQQQKEQQQQQQQTSTTTVITDVAAVEKKKQVKAFMKQPKKQPKKEVWKVVRKQEQHDKKARKQQQQQQPQPQPTKKSPKKFVHDSEESMVVIQQRLLHEITHGIKDTTSGMTTLAMGVQYKDVILVGTSIPNKSKGKGGGSSVAGSRTLSVQRGDVVTVKYKLTSGQTGYLLDRGNKFTFRVGKGEVIQGWDIGILGMTIGIRRTLIVPPKAGYGSKDIGAGPGTILHFDITVLHIQRTPQKTRW